MHTLWAAAIVSTSTGSERNSPVVLQHSVLARAALASPAQVQLQRSRAGHDADVAPYPDDGIVSTMTAMHAQPESEGPKMIAAAARARPDTASYRNLQEATHAWSVLVVQRFPSCSKHVKQTKRKEKTR